MSYETRNHFTPPTPPLSGDFYLKFLQIDYYFPFLYYYTHIHIHHMSHNNTIPLPDLNGLLAHPHSFIIQNNNHFNPTNHKFLKFYLFTLWFFLHFKHSINTHDFNLIINSIFISFHNNSHNHFHYSIFKNKTIHLFQRSSTEH